MKHFIFVLQKGERPTFVMVGESEEKKEKTSQVRNFASEPFDFHVLALGIFFSQLKWTARPLF